MNNQIAPKQAAISHLAPKPVNDPADSRTRREHGSSRSERTDSFGSALRRQVQKSRDERAVTKARDERHSAANDRTATRDRRTKRSEPVNSFDRSDERAPVAETNVRDADQLDEMEKFDEVGSASGHDPAETLNGQETKADPASDRAVEPTLNLHIAAALAEAGEAEVLALEAESLSSATHESALEVEGSDVQPALPDQAEEGALDPQELAVNLAATTSLEESAVSQRVPSPDLMNGESEQADPLEITDSPLADRPGGAKLEVASFEKPGQKQLDSTGKSGLTKQAAAPATITNQDGLTSVAEPSGRSVDGLEAHSAGLDTENSRENHSSGEDAASDSSLSDTAHLVDGQQEATGQASGPASKDGHVMAQPTTAISSSVGSAPDVDAVSEASVADAQLLLRETPSTDGRSGDAVWRQVQRAIGAIRNLGEGDHEFKIRLTPRELGSVTIDIRSSEGGIAIGLVTETTAASDRLNEQRDQLLQELADQGLDSSSVDISQEGASFGLDGRGAWDAEGRGVPGSGPTGPVNADQQEGEHSIQSPHRALGVNQPTGSSRLDMAL